MVSFTVFIKVIIRLQLVAQTGTLTFGTDSTRKGSVSFTSIPPL